MPISNWSTTASSNATADSASGIIWSEGQAPSSINDSARGMMAETRKFYDEQKWYTLATSTLASDTAFVDFALPTDIAKFRFEVDLYAATNSVDFIAYVSRDAGSTWINAAGSYLRSIFLHSGATVTASAGASLTYAHLGPTVTNTATVGVSATINLFKGDATRYPVFKSVFTSYTPSVGLSNGVFSTHATTTGAINRVRLQFSSGNIKAGSVLTLEGLRG